MGKLVKLIGQTFGRWLVIEESKSLGKFRKCRCSCGEEKLVESATLRKGLSVSCGCFRNENPNRKTHGLSQTRTYKIWANIKNRCYNKNRDNYKYYGGRGIKMSARWKESFEVFFTDMGECPINFSIERIDVNGNYTKNNCKWIDKKLQMKNTRRSRKV